MKQLIILFFLVLGFETANADSNSYISIKNKSGNTPVKKKLTCRNWTSNEFAQWIELGIIPDWITKDSSIIYNQDWLKNNYDYRLLTFKQCHKSISSVRSLLLLPKIAYNFSAVSLEIRKFVHYKYIRGQLTGNYRDTAGVLIEVICEPRDQYPIFSKEKTETDMGYLGYDLGSDVCHNFRPVPIFIEEIKVDNSNDDKYDNAELDQGVTNQDQSNKIGLNSSPTNNQVVHSVSVKESENKTIAIDDIPKKQLLKSELLDKHKAEIKAEEKALAEAKIKTKEEAKLKAKIKAESEARAKLQARLKLKADEVKKEKNKAIAIAKVKAEYDLKIKEINKIYH